MPSRIGIRALVSLSSAVLLVVTAVSVLFLLGLVSGLQRSMEAVTRDTRSAAMADEIEMATLMYQRMGNLFLVTGEPHIADERSDLAARIQQLLLQLPLHEGGIEERRLIDRLAPAISAYMKEREALDTADVGLDQVLRSSSVPLGELLDILGALREENDRQVREATAGAHRANRLAIYLATGAILILIGGVVLLGVRVQRQLLRPLLDLHGAMAAFRHGDVSARGRIQGVHEVSELARMFNEMAGTLEQQRRAQLEFLGGVAHDLKNPMSTLKNGIYLLALESSEAQRSSMRSMLDSQIELLVRMVDDFLDSARIEAGELELRCIEFDVRHLTRDLVKAYGSMVPARRLILDNPPDGMVLRADPLRIEQVLRNLLANAIKYSTEGDIVVRVDGDGERVVLEVADRGAGIPAAEQSSIFLPFRRRRFNVAPGVGLGLSVVRRIVRAHGGTIEVESQEGVGSTFRVQLPRVASP